MINQKHNKALHMYRLSDGSNQRRHGGGSSDPPMRLSIRRYYSVHATFSSNNFQVLRRKGIYMVQTFYKGLFSAKAYLAL